jgi:hypothetical protein
MAGKGFWAEVVDTCHEEVSMAVIEAGSPLCHSCPGGRGLGGRTEVPTSPTLVGSVSFNFDAMFD